MSRRLSGEDERLWKALTEAVTDRGPRRLRTDEARLWQAAMGGGAAVPVVNPRPVAAKAPPVAAPAPAAPPVSRPAHPGPPGHIEPGRKRRLIRERDPLDARIDLHGLDQDRARLALERFIAWASHNHYRAVLVITGKGTLGDGVLRRRVPEWLSEPPIREHVAGVSKADRRHGGEGALYVALKRPSR